MANASETTLRKVLERAEKASCDKRESARLFGLGFAKLKRLWPELVVYGFKSVSGVPMPRTGPTLCAIKAPAEPLNILIKPTDSSSVMQRNSPTIGKHTCHSFNSEDVGAWGSGRTVCGSERSARMMGLRGPGVSASLMTRVSGET